MTVIVYLAHHELPDWKK